MRTCWWLMAVGPWKNAERKMPMIRPSKKKHMFLVRISIKKRAGGRFFFCYLLFPIACFLYTLLPSPRDLLELLGQILIKQNISYRLNTSCLILIHTKGLQ